MHMEQSIEILYHQINSKFRLSVLLNEQEGKSFSTISIISEILFLISLWFPNLNVILLFAIYVRH